MSKMRFFALQELANRRPLEVITPSNKLSDYYGSHVFDRKKMQEYLPKEAYKAVTDAIEKGTPINREMADLIANGMKSWAKSLNVTHYTHWFQPLTDGTAEKHDGFIGKDEAIFRILKETIIASEPIRFEGDGYSEQWKQEAAKRGLTNICHVPEALMRYMDNQARSVLIGERIFNETELACRLEVELEKYTMKVQIESRVLGDLAINHIVPTAVIYQNRLLENLRGLRETFSPEEYEVLSADRKELVREISKRVTAIKVQVREMTEARKVANHMDNYKDKAFAYEETVRPYLESIRDHIDHLEMEIDDEIWPLPKYRELLFTK